MPGRQLFLSLVASSAILIGAPPPASVAQTMPTSDPVTANRGSDSNGTKNDAKGVGRC